MTEQLDLRLGRIHDDGSVTFPKLTLSGQVLDRQQMPAVQGVIDDGRWFVALDPFPPKGFDAEAARAELRAQLVNTPVEPVTAIEDGDGLAQNKADDAPGDDGDG